VRRPLSLISAAVLAATSLVALSQSPVSASATTGKATVKTTAAVAPSAVPNATILRLLRLNRTNSFLVLGIDATTAGANMHVWKIKDDLTLDSSFTPVDLGDAFEYPTAANSTCIANQPANRNNSCFRIESFATNETANTYVVAFTRNISVGSGMSSRTNDIYSVAIGSLTASTAPAARSFFRSVSPVYDPTTDFAAFNATNLFGNMCSDTFGATFQGIGLTSTAIDGFSSTIRPDGSVVLPFSCFYITSSANSETEYLNRGLFAVKASGTSVALDNTWGTNGVLKTFDDPNSCGFSFSAGTVDTSITSNTSPKPFVLFITRKYARQTTSPFNNQITSYNGCNFSGMPTYTEAVLSALKADGSTSATNNLPGTYSPNRWIIDSSGRWNSITSTGSGNSATYSLVRLTTTGELDTTNGPSGQRALTGLPATVTVNGASVAMRYSILGIATTATGFLLTGFSSTSTIPNSINCDQPVNYESTLYPYYMTVEDGLVTSYGTNGLGEGVTTQLVTECGSGGTSASFINAKGQHAQLAITRAIGSQIAGLKYTIWDAAPGVIGGGDGSGVIGAASTTRTDNKVYSRKLPTTTQEGTALKVLTKKASRTQMLRSTTPKICVTLTESVVLVDEGRCNVQIVNKSDRRVIRSLSTRVRSTDVEVGTTVEVEDAIPFARVSTRLSKSAREQVVELAESAATAKRIILVGHTALLTEATVSNNFISLQRAAAVKAALQAEFKKAGVNVPISITALGSRAPLTTRSSEAAQSRNRRVDIYVMP
jgi:outer membrane protein OmpA-like peptidoglycan-associated protein